MHTPKSLVKFEMYLASYYTGSRMEAKTLIKDTKGLNDTMQIKEKLVEGSLDEGKADSCSLRVR